MGKKESMDGTVIVRDAATRSQESIPVNDVAAKLKKYKV